MFSRSLGAALCASLALSLAPSPALADAVDTPAETIVTPDVDGIYTIDVGLDANDQPMVETRSDDIIGRGTLIKTGGGELILSGDNSYDGETIIAEGRITTESLNALGDGSVIVKGPGSLIIDAPLHIKGDLIVQDVAEFYIHNDYEVIVDGNLRVGENHRFDMNDLASIKVKGRADIDITNNHLDWRMEGKNTMVRTVGWWKYHSPLSSLIVPGNPMYQMWSSVGVIGITGISLVAAGIYAAVMALGLTFGLIPASMVPAPIRQALGR